MTDPIALAKEINENPGNVEAGRMSHAAEIRFLAERVMKWKQSVGAFYPFTSESDCAALLRALPEEKREEVIGYLECEVVRGGFDDDNPEHTWALLTATPEQRARAVLRAYGYEEGKQA